MTEFRIAVEKIVGHLVRQNAAGQGVSDGQKALIAAVETGLIGSSLGSHISQEYCLGLDWSNEE